MSYEDYPKRVTEDDGVQEDWQGALIGFIMFFIFIGLIALLQGVQIAW